MLPKKRKLYTPNSPEDVGSFLMEVKQKLQEFQAPIKPKIQSMKDPKSFIETISMFKHTEKADAIQEKAEDHNELINHLKVAKELITVSRDQVERWSGIKFKFSNQNLLNRPNLQEFRMWFNPIKIVNKKPAADNENPAAIHQQTSTNSSSSSVQTEESPKAATNVKKQSPQIVVMQPIIEKSRPVLRDIFDRYIATKSPEKGHESGSSRLDENFISQNLRYLKEEEPVDKAEDVHSITGFKKSSSTITKNEYEDHFESFLQSLEDDESENVLLTRGTMCNLGTPSLSDSAKKIRRNKPTNGADYNTVVSRIMKFDASQPSKPNELEKLFQKENVPWNHLQQQQQQKVPSKKVMFKNQTANDIRANPPVCGKTQPKLVSNKVFDELDRLNDKFRMDLKRGGGDSAPLKALNENQKYYSIFNSSHTKTQKLQLKSTTDKNSTADLAVELDDSREEKLKKTMENLQRNKNVPSYMNEFCRLKFGD